MSKISLLSIIAGVMAILALFLPFDDLYIRIYSSSDALNLSIFTVRDLHAEYATYSMTFFPYILLIPVSIGVVGGIFAICGGITLKKRLRLVGGLLVLFGGILGLLLAFGVTVSILFNYTMTETAPNSAFSITPSFAIYIFLLAGIVGVVGTFVPREGGKTSFKVPNRPAVRF